jgi:hypothetical protein
MTLTVANGLLRWFVVSGSIGAIDATGVSLADALAMQLSKVSPTVTVKAGLNTEKQARCQQD